MPLNLTYVAAAVLQKQEGQVLLVQRPPTRSMAGLWEFPGGKLESREPPEQALIREMEEELNLKIAPSDLKPLTFVSHPYGEFHLVMFVYHCRNWQGTLELRENQLNYAWVAPINLKNFAMPEADLPILEILCN